MAATRTQVASYADAGGDARRFASHDYGIGGLALPLAAPPSAPGVIFGIHPRGFAAHLARSPDITRFHLQCPPGDREENRPEERVHEELRSRLTIPDGEIRLGPVVERRRAAAIAAHYDGDDTRLAGYSDARLRRVWQYQERDTSTGKRGERT